MIIESENADIQLMKKNINFRGDNKMAESEFPIFEVHHHSKILPLNSVNNWTGKQCWSR